MYYTARIFFLSLLSTLPFVVQAAEPETQTAIAPPSPAESGNPLPARDDEWRYSIAVPTAWH